MSWYLPRGRIRRSDWWLGYLLAFVLLGWVAGLLDAWLLPHAVAVRVRDDGPDLFWFLPEAAGPVTALTALLVTPPYVAGTVTRLHDRGHSAWWLLWLLLGPLGVTVLVITCGLLGTGPGPNRYGPPPHRPAPTPVRVMVVTQGDRHDEPPPRSGWHRPERTGMQMDTGQWYVSRGRIDRPTFWLRYFLPIAVAGIVASVLDALLGTDFGDLGSGWISLVVTLATIVPSVSSGVTRLHDRGQSAWWLLIGLVPFAGIIVLIVFWSLPGLGGPNRYGPPPTPSGAPAGDTGYPTSYR